MKIIMLLIILSLLLVSCKGDSDYIDVSNTEINFSDGFTMRFFIPPNNESSDVAFEYDGENYTIYVDGEKYFGK